MLNQSPRSGVQDGPYQTNLCKWPHEVQTAVSNIPFEMQVNGGKYIFLKECERWWVVFRYYIASKIYVCIYICIYIYLYVQKLKNIYISHATSELSDFPVQASALASQGPFCRIAVRL